MEPKPPLILNETDLRTGIESKSEERKKNVKIDLLSVLQCMIDNEKTLKIDLYSYENEYDSETYRGVSGWWAYWLDIPILTSSKKNLTNRFKKIFVNKANLFSCFETEYNYNLKFHYFDLFFGDGQFVPLSQRFLKAMSL